MVSDKNVMRFSDRIFCLPLRWMTCKYLYYSEWNRSMTKFTRKTLIFTINYTKALKICLKRCKFKLENCALTILLLAPPSLHNFQQTFNPSDNSFCHPLVINVARDRAQHILIADLSGRPVDALQLFILKYNCWPTKLIYTLYVDQLSGDLWKRMS